MGHSPTSEKASAATEGVQSRRGGLAGKEGGIKRKTP